MIIAVGLKKYLEEIREEVCNQCAGRPAGKETPCGMKLPLDQLVDAMLQEPGRAKEIANGAGNCDIPPAHYCPCPQDRLADLAVKAAEEIDRARLRREREVDHWDD